MIKCDISPDAFRRPGAMTLNMLKSNILVKGVGGTWILEGVEGDIGILEIEFLKDQLKVTSYLVVSHGKPTFGSF